MSLCYYIHSPSLDDPGFWSVCKHYPIWNGHPRFWLWPEPSSFLDVQASDKGHVEEEELLTTLEKEMREATSSLRVEDLLLGSPMGALYIDHLGVFISSGWLNVDFFSPGRYYPGRCFQICFYIHPYLGKISTLIIIFQMGWNHHLVSYIGSTISVFMIPWCIFDMTSVGKNHLLFYQP